jgi:bifunctional DNA-binding transcriptional regulator/antitoxin component of YhaV-PrlF toxin-antitoxin module
MMVASRVARISTGGQIFLPAEIRRRWQVQEVRLTDLGDRLVMEPVLPGDPPARVVLPTRPRG